MNRRDATTPSGRNRYGRDGAGYLVFLVLGFILDVLFIVLVTHP